MIVTISVSIYETVSEEFGSGLTRIDHPNSRSDNTCKSKFVQRNLVDEISPWHIRNMVLG